VVFCEDSAFWHAVTHNNSNRALWGLLKAGGIVFVGSGDHFIAAKKTQGKKAGSGLDKLRLYQVSCA
jgi:hypothetical protein